LIREMGPENVPVVAVIIETGTGLAHLYPRRPGGERWEPLQEGVSLSEALASDAGAPTPRPAGLERESSPEIEGGAGGPERL
jgi:hypothetical protein